MEQQFLLEHRIKLAGEFEVSGKILHALQIYKSILEENPSCSEAAIKNSELYRKTGNIDAAYKLLEDFIEETPGDREVRFYFGEFLLNNAEWEKAVEVLSYFSYEEEPVSSFFTGYAYFMLKDYELAKRSFGSFIKLTEPGDLLFEAYFLSAKIDIECGDYKNASDNLKKAEPGLNNFWEFNYLAAQTYFYRDMNAHAATFIEKSINLNSREALHYNLAGKIYLKMGDYLKAEKYFRKYIEMKENVSPDTYACLGEACLHNSKTREALDLFEKALAADPGNRIAINGKKNAADYK